MNQMFTCAQHQKKLHSHDVCVSYITADLYLLYLLIYPCVLIQFRIVHITVVLTKITKIGSCQNIYVSVHNTDPFCNFIPHRYNPQWSRALAKWYYSFYVEQQSYR